MTAVVATRRTGDAIDERKLPIAASAASLISSPTLERVALMERANSLAETGRARVVSEKQRVTGRRSR
jgi:hypothetical protein